MGHNKIVKNSVIRDNSGGVMHIGTDGENDKYYAVILKCGHVGIGYFIPVCFGVMAKDLESAIKLAKERSRVQRDRKDCVLIAAEVTAAEYFLIHYQNDHDAYIKTNYAAEDVEHIERRRIISPELLQDVVDGKTERTLHRGRSQHIPLLEEIKTADKYAKRIYRELKNTNLNKTDIQYAIIESRIELPREGFSKSLAETIVTFSKDRFSEKESA